MAKVKQNGSSHLSSKVCYYIVLWLMQSVIQLLSIVQFQQCFQEFGELALSYANLYSLSFDADKASLEYLKLYPHVRSAAICSVLSSEWYSQNA